ncbi:MAG: AI-2E family transporter [Ruminococcaceae bacterium]|nr:AI-2E family transporter [Oscillospiraceae bacterium]
MEFNQKSIKTLFGLVAFGVLLFWALQNLSLLGSICSTVFSLILPFLLGGCIAFILNVPMRKIESLLFRKSGKIADKIKRPVSLVLTLLLLVALIAVIFGLVIPELGSSFVLLRDNVIQFLQNLEQEHPAFLNQFLSYLPSAEELAALDWESIVQDVVGFLGNGAGSFINSTVNVASRIFSGIFAFFIGFVFSIYLLVQKETVGRQVRRLIYAYLPENIADRILSIARLSDKTFSSFLSGQCMEALVLGTLFFIVMTIFCFPYALMISVLIGVTALIPVFGAFIGCIIGAFMILMTDGFIKMLTFIAVFLILQQLEGNLIYPKVVGSSVGLPAMWVFVAVSVGGSAFGVLGMLIFIPLCSVLYALLRESVAQHLKKNGIAKDKIS